MKIRFVYPRFLKICFGLMLFFLSSRYQIAQAQEPLMAKGNKALTVSYGVSNIYRTTLNNYLADQKSNLSATENLNNTTKFTNPLQITFDDAISDYTTVGIGVSYYSMHLTEQHIVTHDTFSLDTKGFKAAIQLRGIRYFVQSRRLVCYMFAGAGLRFRSLTDAASDPKSVSNAFIHQIAETKTSGYSAFSFDAGVGLKFLVTRSIGISAETGVTTGIAQLGLFYSFKNKWRRPVDNIGW